MKACPPVKSHPEVPSWRWKSDGGKESAPCAQAGDCLSLTRSALSKTRPLFWRCPDLEKEPGWLTPCIRNAPPPPLLVECNRYVIEKQHRFLKKLKMRSSYDPTALLLGIYERKKTTLNLNTYMLPNVHHVYLKLPRYGSN